MTSSLPAIVLLAGGKASRMGGGDKGLHLLGGQTVLVRIVAQMMPQGSSIALNANGDPARFKNLGIPIVVDSVLESGPLGGVLAGMEWAAALAIRDIVTIPTDTPFLPIDLVRRLVAAREDAGSTIAWAVSEGRVHPVIALWPVQLAGQLRQALVQDKIRKVEQWARNFTVAEARFDSDPVDPFYNINTVADLAAAERSLSEIPD